MSQININTSQNVLITHPAASVGKRILAQLIDFSAIFAYSILLAFLNEAFRFMNSTAATIIIYLPIIFYSLWSELFFHGQSVGKMALNIRVVKLDGSQASFLSYFIRWIFRIIDIPFYGSVAIITIAVNGKGQRLGDIVAGTTVIDLVRRTGFSNSIYRKLPDDYKLQFQEVEKLEEKDIKIINKLMNHHKKNNNRATVDMLMSAKSAVIKKTGIQTDMPPRIFLDTIINDYNYFVRQSVNNHLGK